MLLGWPVPNGTVRHVCFCAWLLAVADVSSGSLALRHAARKGVKVTLAEIDRTSDLRNADLARFQLLSRRHIEAVDVGGPRWTLESISAGLDASRECGFVHDEAQLPACSEATVTNFKKISKVLRQDPSAISDITKSVLLLGENESLQLSSCASQHEGSEWRNLRMVVDSQYVNYPRCCNLTEVAGLKQGEMGQLSSWSEDALLSMQNLTSDKGLQYLLVTPQEGVCTADTKCPLVIQMGANVLPWLLIQAHCTKCASELRTVLVNPQLTDDLPHAENELIGTSNEVLLEQLMPFVSDYLNDHDELDRERVYLVALSQGDDTALRAAMLRPDLFSMVSLSAKLRVSDETTSLMLGEYADSDNSTADRVQPRLKSVLLHVGDDDRCFEDKEFYPAIKEILAGPLLAQTHVELRIFPDSRHTVWWAAWNSLHEVIWTGERTPGEEDDAAKVQMTCRGQH